MPEVSFAELPANPDRQLLQQIRAHFSVHRDEWPGTRRLASPRLKFVARGRIGKDRLHRVAPGRPDSQNLTAVGQAIQDDLLDRDDILRFTRVPPSSIDDSAATSPTAAPRRCPGRRKSSSPEFARPRPAKESSKDPRLARPGSKTHSRSLSFTPREWREPCNEPILSRCIVSFGRGILVRGEHLVGRSL